MAITRYAGDRFVVADTDTKPTGILPGAFLTDSGNLRNYIKTGYTVEAWAILQGGGGGGTPGGSNTEVQFNDNEAFGGSTGLTFDGQRLYVNNFQLSGILYDSNASVGEGGMVLANEGTTGVHWKNIESVLSGVGGSGVANYVARWSDEDTLTSGIIYDDGGSVGIGTTSPSSILELSATSPELKFKDGSTALMTLGHDGSNAAFTAHKGHLVLTASEANKDIEFKAKRDITFHEVGGSEVARIEADTGRVGIGTNAPQAKLHVVGTLETNVHYESATELILEDAETRMQIIADDGGSGGALLCFSTAPAAGDNKHWIMHHAGPSQANNLEFGYLTSTATDFDANGMIPDMVITTAGKVLKLQVLLQLQG